MASQLAQHIADAVRKAEAAANPFAVAAALNAVELHALTDLARSLGLEVLHEAHDAHEVELLAASQPTLLGVNSRNLKTMEVQPDGALALGMMHVLIEEALWDRDFVTNWTHGFSELRSYVAEFTPERVARTTGVSADTVRDLARQVGRSRACSVLMYSGLEYSNSGVQAIRAVWSMIAMAGHFDV